MNANALANHPVLNRLLKRHAPHQIQSCCLPTRPPRTGKKDTQRPRQTPRGATGKAVPNGLQTAPAPLKVGTTPDDHSPGCCMVNPVPGQMAPSPRKLYQCARIGLNDLLFRFITAENSQKSALRNRSINHRAQAFPRVSHCSDSAGGWVDAKRPTQWLSGPQKRRRLSRPRSVHLTP